MFSSVQPNPTDPRKDPKAVVFLTQLLLLFNICHFCTAPNPQSTVKQCGTMLSIDSKCEKCEKTFSWRSQPYMLGRFPAGNLLLSFAILCAGASFRKVQLVFKHMGLLLFHPPTYYFHQRYFLIPTIVKFWKAYQSKILADLAGKKVVLSGDGRHDSMGHSAKFGTYTIFCCTVGLIIHIVLKQVRACACLHTLDTEIIKLNFYSQSWLQANQAGSSNAMEFLGHQEALKFLLIETKMIITKFISDQHKSIGKWMRELPGTLQNQKSSSYCPSV